MFPGANNDLEINFNPESFLRNLAIANKARADFEKGVEGAAARMSTSYEKLSSAMVSQSSRVEQAQNRMVKSLEMRAATSGQSGTQRLIAERDQLLKQYPRMEDADKKQLDRINRITEAYKKLIAVENSSNKGGGTSGGTIAFRAARDIFEGRTAYGVVQAGQGLAGLGGTAMVAGGMAAGLVALTAASVSAMRSLADLGVQVNDVKLRTGLTTKQVGEFSFAAKAVGQDVSVFERSMRGLTQAVEDQSGAGEKARSWLVKFGVDIRGLRDGSAGTADTFEKIAMGLNGMSSPLERNKAMLDLFKRAGIEMIPVMEQLDKNLKTAREYGFGLTDDELQKFLRYKEQMTIIESKWDMVVRHMKEAIATPVAGVVGMYLGMDSDVRNHRNPGAALDDLISGRADGPPMPSGPSGQIGRDAFDQIRLAMVSRYQSGMGLEGQLKIAEQSRSRIGEIDQYSSASDINKARGLDQSIQGIKDRIEAAKQLKELEQDIAKIQIDAAQKSGRPYGITKAEQSLEDLLKKPGASSLEGQAAINAALPGLQRQLGQSFLDTRSRAQAIGTSDIDRTLASLGLGPSPEKGVLGENQTGALRLLMKQNEQSMKDLEPVIRAQEQSQKFSNESDLRSGVTGAQVAGILGPQNPSARMGTEQQIAQIKISAASQEYEQTKRTLTEKEIGEGKLQEARIKGMEEIGKIQDEMAVKQAEEIRRQMDEIKKPAAELFTTLFTHPGKFGSQLSSTIRQAAIRPAVDSLSEGTARLLQPLIFGGGTSGGGLNNVRLIGGAVPVHIVGAGTGSSSTGMLGGPASGGFSGGGSTAGYDTGGGVTFNGAGFAHAGQAIASGIGGGVRFLGAGFEHLGQFVANGATAVGSAVATGATSLAGFVKHIFAPGSSGGDQRQFRVDLRGGDGSSGTGGGGTSGGGVSSGGSLGSGGGDGGSAMPWSGGSANVGGGGHPAVQGVNQGLAGIFGGLRNGGLGGFTRGLPAGTVGFGSDGTPHDDMGNAISGAGPITGLSGAAKGGVNAVGMMAAQWGLLGNGQGSIGGVAAGALGGAAVGFSMGGPLGAAIGGGVGLGIGVGEMIAGVEPQWREAERLVKSVYHININRQEANQIVAIANSKYGSTVSVAVHSPEVRQMLGLFAAGTNQSGSFPQSADTPHGASLIEQGGRLSQQQTFQYGQGYLQQSNLPVAAGSGGAQYLPSPGGAVNLSLNVSGDGIAPFMMGNVITPSVISSQYASAMNSSNGRTDAAMGFADPGEIVS